MNYCERLAELTAELTAELQRALAKYQTSGATKFGSTKNAEIMI